MQTLRLWLADFRVANKRQKLRFGKVADSHQFNYGKHICLIFTQYQQPWHHSQAASVSLRIGVVFK